MKKLLITLAMFSSVNALAFNVQLKDNEAASVEELKKTGASVVSCGEERPRCILMDTEYGIQYPGQEIGDVSLTDVYSSDEAFKHIKVLKDQGLCN